MRYTMDKYTMKRLMFLSVSNDYRTPKELFKKFDQEFHFTLDVCASDGELCKRYFGYHNGTLIDGLMYSWKNEICWMNPPYGKVLKYWIAKAWKESKLNEATVVSLIPARTDTDWFWRFCSNQEIRFIKGRIHFERGIYDHQPLQKIFPAPFPSMVVVFRP